MDYTMMLRMAYNISWKEHLTNKSLYGILPLVPVKIQVRRMRIAGHCARHTEKFRINLFYKNQRNQIGVEDKSHI